MEENNDDPEEMVLASETDSDEENEVEEELFQARNLLDEPNWEEQRLAIVNADAFMGRLQRHEIVLRDDEGEDEGDEQQIADEDEESEEDHDEENPDNESFDTQLPTQHSYLGEGQEVGGRTILDEDLIQEIPIISRPGIILMPGQTLPLNFFHPTVMSMMKKLIEGTKTFGVVHQRYRVSQPGMVDEALIGTTAEIYEFREPPPTSLEVGLKIKAKGRQRFKILSQRRQIDGTKMATVEILREIELPDPFHQVRLISRDRLRPFDEDVSHSMVVDCEKPSSSKSMFANLISRLRHKSNEKENKAEYLPPAFRHKLTKFNHLRTPVYNLPLTPFPNWVYEQYDGNCLVEKAHQLLGNLRLFSQTQVNIPREPQKLSYWLASNLPLDDKHKLRLLEIGCSIRRLRYLISIMEQCPVLCCRNCGEEIGKQEDIFSMSSEGPQGAYVNPGGYVHETLTLYKAKNLSLVGTPSAEYSWFPGYAWTICQCRYCDSHMGWKFTATKPNLIPKKFWGLSRRSMRPQLNMASQEGSEEDAESVRIVY